MWFNYIYVYICLHYRSKTNILSSLGKNYDVHSLSQHTWRFDHQHKFTIAPRGSSLAGKRPLKAANKSFELLGKQKPVHLCLRTFQHIQDLWCAEDKQLDTFRDLHRAYECQRKASKQQFSSFADWRVLVSRANTAEQLQWQAMSHTAHEIERVTLDGVLFRSERSQNRKQSKTDNSCIVCMTEIDYTTGRQRRKKTGIEQCYGRVQTFYLHFKFPPSKEQLREATFKSRIDPAKVGVPFLVVALCDWFMSSAQPYENTKLTQIEPNQLWNNDCPVVDLQDCLSMNVCFWPANPVAVMRQTKADKHRGENDEAMMVTDLVVITHHEEIPVVVNARRRRN
jgi:hypothetical protein